MLYSIASVDGTRWRRLVVAAGAALLLLVAIATYSLLAHRHVGAQPHAGTTSGQPVSEPSPDGPDKATTLAPVPRTADPQAFARAVAESLFSWDTNTLTTPTDLPKRLMAVADPTGESSAGLVTDIADYLPTTEAWAELRQYQTRQWLEIMSIGVPRLWPTAVQQAGPDGLLPGTTAYTIHGVRHRSGIWEDAPVSTAHNVAFTVFLVCGPSYPTCHLLRLSMLDEPLD